jgi:hypothetical protein
VLGLVEALRREAIAEGVETLAHGDLLLRMGCQLGQGYAIARPMPADKLPVWAATWRPPASWQDRMPTPHLMRPLLSAAVEHRAWVQALASHLRGERNRPTMDHHACHFGRWLEGDGRILFEGHPAYTEVMDLHRDVHACAESLAVLGPSEEAQLGLLKLEALRDLLLERLDALESPVTAG